MKKYIALILFSTFCALSLVPGVYSAWKQDLHIQGEVLIKATPPDKSNTQAADAGEKDQERAAKPDKIADNETDNPGEGIKGQTEIAEAINVPQPAEQPAGPREQETAPEGGTVGETENGSTLPEQGDTTEESTDATVSSATEGADDDSAENNDSVAGNDSTGNNESANNNKQEDQQNAADTNE